MWSHPPSTIPLLAELLLLVTSLRFRSKAPCGGHPADTHKRCLEESLLDGGRACWHCQPPLCSTKRPRMLSPRSGFSLTCLSRLLPTLTKRGWERWRHLGCCCLHVQKGERALQCPVSLRLDCTRLSPLSRHGALLNEGLFSFLLPARPGNHRKRLLFFPYNLSGIWHLGKRKKKKDHSFHPKLRSRVTVFSAFWARTLMEALPCSCANSFSHSWGIRIQIKQFLKKGICL